MGLCLAGVFGGTLPHQQLDEDGERVIWVMHEKRMAKMEEHYEVVGKTLGDGQWGTVILGKCKETGNRIAIKQIRKKHVLKHMPVAQLRAEVEISQFVEHPRIVKYLNAFEDRSNLYIVIENLPGGDLFDVLSAEKRLAERQAAIALRQVLASIHYLHQNSICHRDVKMENFMFTTPHDPSKPFEQNILKLIDFSYSKKFLPAGRMHTFLGSPDYVAPQVIAKDYDKACDIWSVGILLYVLLCGYMPFRAESDFEVVKCISKGVYDFPQKEWCAVADEGQALVRCLIDKNDKTRWSAEAAADHPWIEKSIQGGCFDPRVFQRAASKQLGNIHRASRYVLLGQFLA